MAAAPLSESQPTELAVTLLPDRLPMVRHLDPAAALAFRTPMTEHFLSADGKAAGILTLLGLMFTVLARLAAAVAETFNRPGPMRYAVATLLLIFSALALATVFQAFRTIAPRFPKAPPSLAFFGDIARLSREEYIAAMESLNPQQALEQMLTYNHNSARICIEKVRQLALALRIFRFVSCVWVGLLILLSYRVFL